ncbi:hypothetical protein [Streptomyces sp. IB2014 016-6]|uniref:hypothetical protein n=1 Tax=Streptomyces sp. IB2014 016-6 TaxID=2517818 RepID=UPI0011CAEC6C|nr:hypothetical protein [Streptomyces sp. IB2014 016-6]TXL89833.1 hypothetical protein EW053_12430 [Streptomyces sp. IB2014 016-6]
MKAIRRWGPYLALSLVLVVATGYGWYRVSDTGEGWRYEESLKSFCEGLIPYEESAWYTGKDGTRLTLDHRRGGPDGDFDSCTVAGLDLTIARVPDPTAKYWEKSDAFQRLDEVSGDSPPTPLGGGWRGYTDLANTAVVLNCHNKAGAVFVTANDRDVDDLDDMYDASDSERARGIAEFVAATAVNAAEDWDCEAKAGGSIPRLPAPAERTSPFAAKGTCAGIPLRDQDYVHWIQDAPESGTAPLERCVLGETKAEAVHLFDFEAAFGPFAQRLRSDDPDARTHQRGAGGAKGSYWATAKCPGDGPRALFRVDPTQYVYVDGSVDEFARDALTAFAERRAAQHGCTDLTLPPVSP